MFARRTDHASEAREFFSAQNSSSPKGVRHEEYSRDGVEITEIHILNEDGEQALGKPAGAYITASLRSDWLKDSQWIFKTACVLSSFLKDMLPKEGSVLAVGLGNRNITPDRLGPDAIDSVIVTRHLIRQMPGEFSSLRSACAIATGVLGLTGIETAEIVKGVADRAQISAVIAIDALCSASQTRLCRTFQISDTGITPGSGAFNSRSALNMQTLGVPVIAIGVPTVIDSKTLMADALEKLGGDTSSLKDIDSMLVAPKDIDILVSKSAKVIGYAINMALHGEMSAAEMEQFLE